MWFRKKVACAEYVECVGCGCLMNKARKVVGVETSMYSPSDTSSTFVYYSPPSHSTESYCGVCAPIYDIRRVEGGKACYYRKEPAKHVEVTEKGKAIS